MLRQSIIAFGFVVLSSSTAAAAAATDLPEFVYYVGAHHQGEGGLKGPQYLYPNKHTASSAAVYFNMPYSEISTKGIEELFADHHSKDRPPHPYSDVKYTLIDDAIIPDKHISWSRGPLPKDGTTYW